MVSESQLQETPVPQRSPVWCHHLAHSDEPPLAESDVEKLVFSDCFKSMHLVTTARIVPFDYARLFNPSICEWAYGHNDMSSELDRLS